MIGRALRRLWRHMQQVVCGLHGHDALLHFEGTRVCLQCSSCGWESPGWDLRGARSTMRVRVLPLVHASQARGGRPAQSDRARRRAVAVGES